MTEEEIEKQAEEYIIKTVCKTECPVWNIHSGCTIPRKDCNHTSNRLKGYIDGAKLGIEHTTEWHDLREDPTDLPKLADKCFSWSITVANQDGEACEYNYRLSRWQNCLSGEIDEPIKWCELPTYKE